jgi:brefeldin A-inhibited guanine nucleotide-exchange protein
VLVTRSLSRLSRRVIGDSPQADSVLVQSRVYAVELLCILFAGFGRRHPPPPATPMIADMRSYALECILTNICTTAPTSLFAMSISIFRSVIANVRRVCKHQVTVVFTRVVLPILTLPSSSFGQKVAILQLLQAICADSKVLVEVFLNNDCDKRCIALFENIVAALRRTVLTNHVEKQWITAQQSAILQHYALQALVSVLRSLAAALPAMEAVETPPALLYQLRLVRGRMVWNSQGWKKGYPWLKANEPDIPVHEFLRFAPSLSATEIGGFFSPKKEEHMKAFEAYLSYFDFSNKQLDMALRELMMAFRMAGESQIIDRLFGLFAKKYNADNGSPFTDDGAYFLSFATMMLHTQKHNPNAELSMRMTKENFISYQAGQNGGSDFSPELLSDIYDRISRFEIKIEHDTDPSPPPQDIELEESLTQSNGEREKEREKERELERGLELGTGVFLPHTKVKQLRFIQDARALVKKATHYLRRYCHPYDYVEVCGAEAVGLMFSLAWPHILAGVQYTMQRADEHPVLALCYEALALASDLGVRFGVDSEELSLIAHQLTAAPDSRLPGPFPLTLTTFDINAF